MLFWHCGSKSTKYGVLWDENFRFSQSKMLQRNGDIRFKMLELKFPMYDKKFYNQFEQIS